MLARQALLVRSGWNIFQSSLLVFCLSILIGTTASNAQTTYDWQTTAPDGNWRQGIASGPRWNPGGLWDEPPSTSATRLRFNNNTFTNMTNNVPGTYTIGQLFFGSAATSARTLSGGTLQFFEFGSTWPRIENQSTTLHTFNIPFSASTNAGFNMELVASSGNIDFGSAATINTNGRVIQIYGNNISVDGTNRAIRLTGVVSGSGTLNVSLFGVAKLNGAHTYTGQTQVDNGELWIESSGSISSSSSIFVGNGGQPANVAKLWLSHTTGGTTFSNNFTINNGNATTREIGGLNTSGTHTFSGNITNNSTTGGLLLSTISSGGSVTFSGVLSGGGAYTTQGAGTITFSGTSANTYSGTTSVNGGTLVLNKTAGTIAIPTNTTVATGATIRTDAANQWGTGAVPLVTLNGTATLNLNNNNQKIALASASSTASVTLGSATLNIDNTGTDTYAGVISGSGSVVKTSAGIQVLSGANTYTGTTTVTGGTLRLGTAGVIADASNVILNGGTFSTGSGAGFSETVGTLNLNATSTIAFGTGSHNLNFAASNGVSWAGGFLFVTGWTGGFNGTPGTAGRLFVGSSASGLTTDQLVKVLFLNGTNYHTATILSSGEVVPTALVAMFWNGAGTWTTANTWSLNPTGPYNQTWVSGRAAYFNVAASTVTGATTNVGSITAFEDVTLTGSGTMGFGAAGGGIAPIYVASTKNFSSSQALSTAAGNGLIKNGPGVFSSSNGNATGIPAGITLNDGAMVWAGVNGFGSGTITINSGVLSNNNNTAKTIPNGAITVNGDFAFGSTSLVPAGTGNLTFSATVALGSSVTRTISLGNTGIYTLNGVISGTGSNLTLAATSAGVLALGGVNTYGGNTTINGGTLRLITGADRLPTTTGLSLANTSGAIFDLNGQSQTISSLSGGGTIGGNVTLGSGTLTVNQSTTTTYSGVISGTSGNLVKTGSGVLILANAANAHTGTTTILAGELRLNPVANATYASQIVLNGGTLSTSGISATRTWTSSSTLRLDANSIISLGSGDHTLTFANSSAVTWTGTTLTINGWTGVGGSSGTGGKIIVGAGGLTGAQLAKISFTGYPGTPIILAGELVPPGAGATYTWNGSQAGGLWTNNLNWTPNGVPGASDNVVIPNVGSYTNELNITGSQSAFDFTVDANGTYTMAAGSTLTIGGTYTYNSSTAPTFSCTSTLAISGGGANTIPAHNYGNLNISGGPRTLAGSGTIGICGTYTQGSPMTVTGSTVNFNGTGAQTIAAATYNNLTISNARGGNAITLPAGTIAVGGTFDISTLSGFTASVNASSIFDFTSASDQSIPAFFYGQLNNSGNGNRTWASSGIIDINQGFSPGGGTHTITGSTIRYSNTSATTWNLTSFSTNIAARQYNNLIFNGGGTTIWSQNGITLGIANNLNVTGGTLVVGSAGGAGVLNIDGTFTIDGGTLNLSNSTTNAGTINLTGNFVQSGGLFNKSGSATGTFNFSKTTGTQTIQQTGGTITNNGTNWNLGTGSTSNTVQLISNLVVGAGVVNARGSATVDFQTFVLSGTTTFTTFAGTTLITANVNGINHAAASGSVQCTTRPFTTSGVSYVFNGTSAQVTGTALNPAASFQTIANLTINNAAGVTLSGTGGSGNAGNAVIVTGTVTLNSGVLTLDTRDLQINQGASISGTFSATEMIATIGTNRNNGRLVRVYASGSGSGQTFTYPLGDVSGTAQYSPFHVTNLSYSTAGAPFIAIKVKDGKQPFDASLDNYLTRFWEITTGTSFAGASAITFTFNANYITGSEDVVGNDNLFKVNRFSWTSGSWTEDAGSSCASGTLTSANLNNAALFNDHDITGKLDAPIYFRTVGSGNWENPAIWEASTDPAFVSPAGVTPSIYPVFSNSAGIIIRTGHNATVTTLAVLGGVPLDETTVESGATLTIQSSAAITVADGTGTDLVVNGTVVNQSSSASTVVGTVQFANGSLYNHQVNSGTVLTATWDSGSECRITGVTATAPSGLGQAFSDFTWQCTAQSGTVTLNSALTTVNRDFKVSGTNSNTLSLSSTSALTLAIGRNFEISSGFVAGVTGANASAVNINIANDFIISGNGGFTGANSSSSGAGAVALTVGNSMSNTSSVGTSLVLTASGKAVTLTIANGYTQNGSGTVSLVQSSGAGTFTVTAGNFTLTNGNFYLNNGGSGAAVLNQNDASGNLTLNGGNFNLIQTATAPSVRPTVNIAGNYMQTNTNVEFSVAYSGSLNPPGEILVAGNFTRSGTGYIRNTSASNNARITFNGSNQTYNSSSSGNFTFTNVQINNGSNLVLGSNLDLTGAAGPVQTITVLSGGRLSTNGFITTGPATYSSTVVSSGASISTFSSAGFTSSGATGGVQTSVRSYSSGATYIFNGSSAQNTGNFIASTTPTANQVGAFTIDNAAGVTLDAPATTTGNVTLSDGLFNLGNNSLTVNGSISGASSARYLVTNGTGELRQTVGAGAVAFPVGNAAYNPITFNNSGTPRVLGVIVNNSIAPALNDATKVVNRSWAVSTSGGGLNLSVVAQWNLPEEAVNFSSNSPEYIGLWNGSVWTQNGATKAGSDPYTFTSTSNFTSVGLFALGTDDAFISPSVTYTWTGNVNSSWTNPNNWNPNTSIAGPTSADNIIINAPGLADNLNITDARIISNVTFNGTGIMNMGATGALTINGTVTYGGSFTANLNCASTITYNNPASLTIPPFNYGNLANANSSVRTWAAGATTGICGTLTTGTGSSFTAGANSTVNYNGTGAQTIEPLAYANLTISNARGSANITSPAGTISVSGTFDVSTLSAYTPVVNTASIFDFTAATAQNIPAFFYGQLNNSGNGNRTWASSGVIDIAQGFNPGTGTQTITGSTIRYSNTSAGTWNLTNFTTNIAGRQYNNLELVGGASTTWQPGSTFNMGIAGDLTISGLGRLIANPTSGLLTWTVDGNFTINGGGVFTGSNSTGTTNFNVTGNSDFSNATATIVGSATGAGLITSFSTNNLSISGTSTFVMDAASNTANANVTVNGNLNITSTAANAINWGSGTANANNVLNLKGNFTKSGTGTIGQSGTYAATAGFTFNGTGTQTYNHSGAAMTSGQITIAAGSTVQLASNLTMGSTANTNPLTIQGTLDCGTFVVAPGNAANTFTLSGTGTLKTANSGGVGATVSGYSTSTWAAGATFEFSGATQNAGTATYAGIGSGTNYNLTWSGTSSLTLDKSLSISTLNFSTNGLIFLGAFDITIPNTGSIVGTGFSSSKMIVADGTGQLRKAFTTPSSVSFTWPIGDNTSGADYSPVTLVLTSAGSGTLGFRVVDAAHPNNSPSPNYITRYWPATSSFAVNYNYTATMQYVAADIVGTESAMKLNIWFPSASGWTEYAGSAGSNVVTGTVGASTTSLNGTDLTARTDVPIYYRTVTTGTWASLATWEIADNVSFTGAVPATVVPNNVNSAGIWVRNTHTVTIGSAVSADDLTIDNGGALTVGAGGSFNLVNGPAATDFVSNGTLNIGNTTDFASGAVVNLNNAVNVTTANFTSAATVSVGAAVIYTHNVNGGSIPTATWADGCELRIAGVTNSGLTGGLSQSFWNVVWQCAGQSAAINLSSTPITTVRNNLTVNNTNGFELRFYSGNTGGTTNIGGNLVVAGGNLALSGGGSSTASTVTVNVTGNVELNGGTFSTAGSSNTAAATLDLNIGGNMTIAGGNFNWYPGAFTITATHTINLAGNFSMSSGSINRTGTFTNIFRFSHASNTQSFTISGGSISGITTWQVGNGSGSNTVALGSNINLGTAASTFTVRSGSHIRFDNFVLSGSSSTFTMENNARLLTANANGITTSGASGSVQVGGTRTYTGASNNNHFTYNSSSANQAVGSGLPAIMAALTINNTAGAGNNTVSLPNSTFTISTLNLQAGLLDQPLGNLIIASSGSVNGSGGDFAPTSLAFVTFQGSNVVNGTVGFRNCEANGGVNFGLLSTINNTFRINAGGFVSTNGPTYATGSTLNYATNGNYDRGLEWNPISGRGAPHHVLISGTSTNLNPARIGASYATVPLNTAGDLTINSSCGLYMDFGCPSCNNMTVPLNIGGDLILFGGLSGSQAVGGDINVAGNWTNNGSGTNFFPNGRQVAFNGSAAQIIGGSNATNIPFAFLAISNTGANVTTNRPITVNNRLQMNSGLLVLGNNNLVLSGSAFFDNGGANSYVVTNGTGTVTQEVNTGGGDEWYPIGPTTSIFGPVTLRQTGTTDNITVFVKVAPAYTNAVNDNTQMVQLEWTLNESTAGGNNLRTIFGWTAASEAVSFDRASGVYHGHWNGAKYIVRAANATTGSDPYFSLSTLSQPYTGNLATQRFVVGNINGILPCFQTLAAGDWNTASNWVDGIVPPTDATVCLNHAMTLATAPPNPSGMTINAGGSLAINNGVTLTFESPAFITNSSGVFQNMTTGTIAFSNLGVVNGAQAIGFNRLQLNGNTTFTTIPTINTEMEILTGGFVISANGPNYGPTSTLKYNTGGSYNRSNEWRATSGAGFPANVLVTGNTSLNLDAGTGVNRTIQGSLQVDNGSSITQGATGFNLTVPGNFTLNGSYTQSTTAGGDLILGGNWNSGASATLTSNNRDVRFNGTAAQTIATASPVNFGFLTIDNSADAVSLLSNIRAQTFRVNAGRTFDLTAANKISILDNGSVLINGTFNANNGTIEYLNGGNFTNNGTFNRGTSTIDFLPNASFTGFVSGSVQTNFHNIYLGSFSGIDFNSGPLRGRVSGVFQLRNGSFVSGNSPIYELGSKLMYSGGGTFNRNVEWDPATLQKVEIRNNTTLKCGTNGVGFSHVMADSLIIQSGSVFDMSGPDMTAPTVVGGSVLLQGTLNLSNTAGGDLQVAGDWNNNGGTFNCNGRLTTFIGAANAELKGPSATTFCFLSVNKTSGNSITATVPFTVSQAPGGTEVRIIGGTLDLNNQILTLGAGSNTLRINAGYAAGQTLRTGGSNISGFNNYTDDGVSTATLGGRVDYSGTAAETYTGNVNTYFQLWNTGASIKTIPQTLIVRDSLWIAPSTSIDFAASSFNLEARGHVVNHGSTVGSSTGTILLNGTTNQHMRGNGIYRNLDVNNSSNISSFDKPTITGKLNILLGKVETGSDTIILGPTATITETIGAGEHFVRGNLKTTRSVGTAAENFGGMGVNLTAGSDLGTVVVNRQSGVALNGQPPCCTGFSTIFRNWTIVPSIQPASPDRDLTLSWPSQDDNGMDMTALQLWKRETVSSDWNQIGFPQNVLASNPRVATWTGVTGFSQFTGADLFNPLPLGLVQFNGKNQNGIGYLTWSMANEKEVLAYTLEKSLNGRDFSAINHQTAKGNLSSEAHYAYVDRSLNADSYYRLTVHFANGSVEMSHIIVIRTGRKELKTIAIYPNPSHGTAALIWDGMLQSDESLSVSIFGTDGKAYGQFEGNLNALNQWFENASSALAAGVYQIQVVSESTSKTLRFMKR